MTGVVAAAARLPSVTRISRMVLRNVIRGKPARSVGQPSRVTSALLPVVRMPPSVRITSDSCSRAISGFSIRLTAGCARLGVTGGCFGAAATVRFSGMNGVLV